MRNAFNVIGTCLLLVAVTPALASQPAKPLAGTTWRPVALSGVAGTKANPVFLRFASADQVSGSGGCNRFFGSYRQRADHVTISQLGTTRKACPSDIMWREQRFLELLRKTRRVKITGSELALMTLGGAVFLRLEPHE